MSARDHLARIVAVGAFVALWAVRWAGESASDQPYYDVGRTGFLILTATLTTILAGLYAPALWTVIFGAMPANTRLMCAGVVAVGVAVAAVGHVLYFTYWPESDWLWFASPIGSAAAANAGVLWLTLHDRWTQQNTSE